MRRLAEVRRPEATDGPGPDAPPGAGRGASGLALRPYAPSDRLAVLALHRLALEATGAYLGPGPWDADLGDIEAAYGPGGGLFLVGEAGGRLVAMGGVRVLGPDGRRGLVKRMRVAPDCQGRGYGRALLEALERHARAVGVRVLALDTTTGQARALRLYRRAGYRESGRRALRGFTVVFFEKSLDPPDPPGPAPARAGGPGSGGRGR